MSSNVGSSNLYADGDQRTKSNDETNQEKAEQRYHEGQPNSHLANDSSTSSPFSVPAKDERSIANKLAREEKREKEPEPKSRETEQLQKDATLPARSHGNEPSKGAKIDQELKEEEEAILKKKGAFGPK